MANQHPDFFIPLEIHVSDSYDTAWGYSRASFYNVTTIPRVWFDGVTEVRGASSVSSAYSRYRATFLTRQADPTDIVVDLSASPSGGQTFDVTTSVTMEADGTAGPLQLYLVEALDHWPASPSYARNTFRQAITTGMDFSLLPGQTQEFTASVALDSTSWSHLEDVKMIAWVQAPGSAGPAEIYNATQLYISQPSPADFDEDGDVDGDDFLAWQASFGLHGGGDADGDGDTDGDDFLVWQSEFGSQSGSGSATRAIPEPAAILLALTALGIAGTRRRGRRPRTH